MSKKIQTALGRNAMIAHPALFQKGTTDHDVGQAVLDGVNTYLVWGLNHDDGSELVRSIYSQNLRDSALFSAKSARIVYLLGKATLLDAPSRKSVVRNQVIEYGAVAEAILLDVIQSVGMNDRPAGARPASCNGNHVIDWKKDGLFTRKWPSSHKMRHRFEFYWLIDRAKTLGVIDQKLAKRLDGLRESRNLVHPVIPTSQRYKDDISRSRTAREIVLALRDAVLAFKKANGLP